MSSLRFAVVAAIAIVAACDPIEPVPLSNAPVNLCGCEAYGATTPVRCNAKTNRCENGSATRPTFPFYVVVHVPTSNYYGAGQTFVLYSGTGGAPTFTRATSANAPTQCTASADQACVGLQGSTFVSSQYRVSASQSALAGYPLNDNQLIPARVELEPVANIRVGTAAIPDDSISFVAGLPIQTRFVTSRLGGEGAETSYSVPAGIYRRTLYPEPPFDALFPPRATFAPTPVGTIGIAPDDATDPTRRTTRIVFPGPEPRTARIPSPFDYQSFVDTFVLRDDTIDPLDTRGVTVQRAEGLEGWQVWVADSTSKHRISTLRTLAGSAQTLTMVTTGERRAANNGLGNNVEVIVAPPANYVAVPRFINPVNGGDLGTIRYPSIPAPVRVLGGVTEPESRQLGYGAHIEFESKTIETLRDQNPLLHYKTTVDTDDLGRFATILPRGTYAVTVEPLPGAPFAKYRYGSLLVDLEKCPDDPGDPNGCKTLSLQPPRKTLVTGTVRLADQRPLAEATILAIPQTPTIADVAKARPNQTRASLEGRFVLDLDQGMYLITAVPKAGTGFPRVVTQVNIVPGEMELSEITIPAPIPLSFTLRGAEFFEGPIPNAIVRIFSVPGASGPTAAGGEAVEIGLGSTDANGLVEILLAPGTN